MKTKRESQCMSVSIERDNRQREKGRQQKIFLCLHEEEQSCIQSISKMYENYLKQLKKTQLLREERGEMERNKIKIFGTESFRDSCTKIEIVKFKELLSKKENELISVKKEVIANSGKIRQTVKDVGELKGQIIAKECQFQKIKQHKIEQDQYTMDQQNEIKKINALIKAESVRKVSLLKQLNVERIKTISQPSLADLVSQIVKMQTTNKEMNKMLDQIKKC